MPSRVFIQLWMSSYVNLLEKIYFRVTFTPTVEHCSMATVIGLCLRVKLMRSLPPRYKVIIKDSLVNHTLVFELMDVSNFSNDHPL